MSERHPVSTLLEQIRSALADPSSPARLFAGDRVYILDDESLVPEEAQTPFYGVAVRSGTPSKGQEDRLPLTYQIAVTAYQAITLPEIGQGQTGLAPSGDPARAGLLDLVWAAFETLRGRHFAGGKFFSFVAESATEAVVTPAPGSTEERPIYTGFLKRSITLAYGVAIDVTPRPEG